MGFQAPLYKLSDYLDWATSGKLQLPDFQREYKWDEERIRQLLITVLRAHPMGIVLLLKTGNDEVYFKPRPLAGTDVGSTQPEFLLLDGQQRLTSLTQALTGSGIVETMDARGKMLQRRYYLDMRLALEGEDRMDEAVVAVPGDGIERRDFGRVIERDYSTPDKERAAGVFPLRLLLQPAEAMDWFFAGEDRIIARNFNKSVITPALSYNIPAIELDNATTKSAVATVFEKVNTGGLGLNVFELLTATFAGDRAYYEQYGTSFRLNDDWKETQKLFSDYPVLGHLENTDFLQAITLLATRERNLKDTSSRPPAVSAKREDILKLTLDDYLKWVEPLRQAFIWSATFLADRHIFDSQFVPYPKQLVPLAAIRVAMGKDADLIKPRERLVQWFWCGIMGELYGGSIATRFVRDLEQVPTWALEGDSANKPSTVSDATFVESRLHSLRTRNAAAYKGVYALLLANGACDWMEAKALDKAQYADLAVDIHHVFPTAWCQRNGIDDEHRQSIVNKTPLSAVTNRTIGGAAPSSYIQVIEDRAQISDKELDQLLLTHAVAPERLRTDDFDGFFADRREQLCVLVEQATGKDVPRDMQRGEATEDSSHFEASEILIQEERSAVE